MILESVILGAVLIFFARVVSIAISTVRSLFMTRGLKWLSAFLGFFEALLFVITITQVVQDLSNIWNLVSYSAGFSAGMFLGIAIEDRLALGYATVQVISSHRGHKVAEAIRQAGYGATESWGKGSEGEVGIVRTVVRRREVELVNGIANQADPASFVTVEQTMTVRRGHLGIIQLRSGLR